MTTLPALKAACLFALGVSLALWNPLPFSLLAAATLLLLLAALTLRRRSVADVILASCLIAGGATAYEGAIPAEPSRTLKAHLLCIVEEPPLYRNGRFSFTAKTISLGSDAEHLAPTRGRVWVRGRGNKPPEMGTTLQLDGELKPLPRARNPGSFNLRRWRQADGYVGELDVNAMTPPPRRQPTTTLYRVRQALSDACDRLAGRDAPLWKGLLLGFRRDLDPILMEELRVTGLTHLLALSGLNIGFLAAAFMGVCSVLRLKPWARAVVALTLVLGYALIIPDRGCTVRATVMVAVLLSAAALRRWTPGLNALGLAALLLLAYRPADLFDPGFQMSFAATAGIMLCYRDIIAAQNWRISSASQERRLAQQWVSGPFLVSLAASLFVFPLSSLYFSNIALGGPLFNLAAVPLLGVVYAGAWLAVFLLPVSTPIAELVADGVLGVGWIWRQATQLMAMAAPVWEFTLAPLTVGLLGALLVWGTASRRPAAVRIALTTVLTATVLLLSLIRLPGGRFQALFLDVGHGDAAFWLFPDERTAVVDAGPDDSFPGDGVLARVLKRLNRPRLDIIIASHSEADHIGGFADLITTFPVASALSNGQTAATETFHRLQEASREAGLTWQTAKGDDLIRGVSAGYRLDLLGPPPEHQGWSANNASLVLRLSVPDGKGGMLRLLTTGDIERMGEGALARRGNVSAELLKVPHHGSPTSSSREFIHAVAPAIAVVSRGGVEERANRAKVAQVFARYRDEGARVLSTETEGALLFEAAPEGWRRVDWRKPSLWRWLVGSL